MAKKFYAVKNGRETGIFKTWTECRRQVLGFENAVFRGFDTLEAALAYLNDTELPARDARDGAAAAYVDGSYDIRTNRFSYGMVLFYGGGEHRQSGAFSDTKLAAMQNVAGEVRGAMEAMKYCADNGIEKLDIYYDYAGIENWCTGAWRANKPGTIDYKAYYDRASDKVDIRFIKVKGHSGDRYNDLADRLAKEALGIYV